MTRASGIPMAAWLALSAMLGAQQPVRDANRPATGAALVEGQVVTDEPAAKPIRRAVVTLSGGDLVNSRTTITDDSGRFVFRSLPGGRYTITATKGGHVPTAYGSPRPGRPGTALMLGATERASIALKMTLGAVVTGVLRDERNDPLPNALVAVSTTSAAPDRWFSTPEYALTDDRGVYRIFGLVPGEYVVAAIPSGGGGSEIGRRSETEMDATLAALRSQTSKPTDPALAAPKSFAYAPTFFPGTPLYTSASRFRLTAGEERSGVDFSIVGMAVASIAGVIQRPDGLSPITAELSILIDGPRFTARAMGPGATTFPILSNRPDAQGAFKFTNVMPGHYTLLARLNPAAVAPARDSGSGRSSAGGDVVSGGGGVPVSGAGASEMLYGLAEVDVTGADVANVALVMQPGSTMSGRLVFESTAIAPPADVTTLRLSIGPPGGTNYTSTNNTIIGNSYRAVQPATIAPDGSFLLKSIAPGNYVFFHTLPAGTPAGWWLRSATIDGRDVLDLPLDFGMNMHVRDAVLKFSDKHADLSGVLQNAAARPAPDYFVAVFPVDRALWRAGSRRIKSARPATDGRFTIKDVVPGDYYLAALTDLDASDWNDPKFFEALVLASIKVTIGEGEKKTQDLRIGG